MSAFSTAAREHWFRASKLCDLIVVSSGDGTMEEITRYGDWLHGSSDRCRIEKTGTVFEWCIEHGVPLVRCAGHDMAAILPITDEQTFEVRMRWT